MDLDEIKNKAPLFSNLIIGESDKTADCTSIEDYVLEKLGIDKSNVEDSELLCKNFVHLMIHVYEDIREIEERLEEYRKRHDALQNIKGNKAEFERRKLVYFCDLNKKALQEINSFISHSVPSFLSDHRYDTLKRECERGGTPDLFYNNRYKYAWYRDYYSIGYPSEALVKISQYVREKFKLEQYIGENKRFIHTYENQPDLF